MFGKTKKPANYQPDMHERIYSQEALVAIAASIDELEKYECSPDAVGSCLATVLSKMGYSDEEALSGSIDATKMLDTSFSALYWKANSLGEKIGVFSSTLEATRMLIEKGMLNEQTRQKAQETIAEARARGDKVFGK